MVSSEDKMRIFENVVARVGLSGDVFGEYTKALSQLNNIQTYREFNTPVSPIAPQNLPPQREDETISPAISPEIEQNTAQAVSPLNSPEMA